MARTTAQLQPANLTVKQIESAIPRLRLRVSDLEHFNPASLNERGGPEIKTLELAIEQTLQDVLGHNSIEYDRYSPNARFNGGPMIVSNSIASVRRGVGMVGPDLTFRTYYEKSRQNAIAMLLQLITSLEERAATLQSEGQEKSIAQPARGALSTEKVFVVHGHDGETQQAVCRFLERLRLKPIVLHERASKGRSLLNKFRDESSDVGFAVVLMTADDIGGISVEKLFPRARQNVILELGYFLGILGDSKVVALVNRAPFRLRGDRLCTSHR